MNSLQTFWVHYHYLDLIPSLIPKKYFTDNPFLRRQIKGKAV
jgi:hypothetical protein